MTLRRQNFSVSHTASSDFRQTSRWLSLWRSVAMALPLFTAVAAQAQDTDGFSCSRKGRSAHSLSVAGGFVESRFKINIMAPVEVEPFQAALDPAFDRSPQAVARWLETGSGASLALAGNSGARLIRQYYSSITFRKDLADVLQQQPQAQSSLTALANSGGVSEFLLDLAPDQIGLLAALSSSSDASVSNFGSRLSLAVAQDADSARDVLLELTSSSELVLPVVQELLKSEDSGLTGIALDLISSEGFVPVLLSAPGIAGAILAQPGGLDAFIGSLGEQAVDLGGNITWAPEQELNLALTYGYDALSWLTLNVGYRYFGADKGLRTAQTTAANPGLSASFAKLRAHRLETGVEIGCYFDVWRPFISLGAAYAHRRFSASDPLLGSLERTDWIYSYFYSAGLDVDLSQYVEMRIGYQVEHYPRHRSRAVHQIEYAPDGFSEPIRLNNVAVTVQQSGVVSGFFVYFRLFL